MLKLPPVNILHPQNPDELLSAIGRQQDRGKLIGGGTDLVNGMKKRLYPESVLISLKKIPEFRELSYQQKSDRLTVGAMVTLAELADFSAAGKIQPAISETIRLVAAPPIRNQATIGGNLCLDTRCYFFNQSQSWRKLSPPCFKSGGAVCNAIKGSRECRAVFSADLPPLLIALGAEITIVGREVERTIPLAEFYTNNGAAPNILKKDEYLSRMTINNLSGKKALYRKFRLRKALDFPLAGIALAFTNRQDDKFSDPIVILNAVASGPTTVTAAAKMLAGRSFADTEALAAAAEAAQAAAKPIANAGSQPFYRRKMIGLLLKKIAAELTAGQEA